MFRLSVQWDKNHPVAMKCSVALIALSIADSAPHYEQLLGDPWMTLRGQLSALDNFSFSQGAPIPNRLHLL